MFNIGKTKCCCDNSFYANCRFSCTDLHFLLWRWLTLEITLTMLLVYFQVWRIHQITTAVRTCAGSVIEMVKSQCIRSFALSSILVAVIIVLQLIMIEDTTSDAQSFLRENNIIVTDRGDEHDWNRRSAVESFSLMCPSCSFANISSISRTSGNDSERVLDPVYSYLREYVHKLNRAPVVRNLDKFDIPADTEGSLVIVIQVCSCLFIDSLIAYSSFVHLIGSILYEYWFWTMSFVESLKIDDLCLEFNFLFNY